MAVIRNDNQVELYDINSGTQLMFFMPCKLAPNAISISQEGNVLAMAFDDSVKLFKKHENCTLEQIQLKCALLTWLQLEKPDKRILEGVEVSGILERLFADISLKCDLDYENECVNVWSTFLPKMQYAFLKTLEDRIIKYGK